MPKPYQLLERARRAPQQAGGRAKAYQVRQVIELIDDYDLLSAVDHDRSED